MKNPKSKTAAKSVTRTIKVDELARVEGEGALTVRVKDGVIKDIKFRIFEPPRFFEAFLQGRMFTDAPDLTARICGICPLAYMMGASHAMEDALGVTVTGPLRDLRRMIYCGEWIESHVLHAAMLHAPDFLGLDDVLQIAKTHPKVVENALQIKKLGNDILEVIGGRAVHPVNLKIGGFYKAPKKADMRALEDRLKWAIETGIELGKLFATFDFPDFEYPYTSVALKHPDEYAITEGRIVSSRGLDVPLSEFLDHFGEEHVAHTNALHGIDYNAPNGYDGAYMVGPNARYNLNYDQLSDLSKEVAKEVGLGNQCNNPYKSILVRMVETVHACEEALRLCQNYEVPDVSCVEVTPKAGSGFGCTEAPRGICFHHYKLDDEGRI